MENKKDIKILRDEINSINSEILTLFIRRMEISKEIAEYKIQNKLPVLDRKREKEIIEEIEKTAGEEYARRARVLFKTIIDLSKSAQEKIVKESRDK